MISLDAAAVVAALLELPGVAAARIEPVEGTPGNLVLDLGPDADAAHVADDVTAMLRARFGLGVAAEPVSPRTGAPSSDEVLAAVLHLRPVPPPPPSPPPAATAAPQPSPPSGAPEASVPGPALGARPGFGSLRLAPDGLGVTVAVELSWLQASGPGYRTVGEAGAPNTSDGVRRAVAEAALRAVNAELGAAVRLDLADLAVVPVGQHRVAVVRATWSDAAGVAAVTGASDVRDDVRQAIVRAVLAATNRRLVQA